MRGTKRRPTRQPASASLNTSDARRVLAVLDQPQPVLELRHPELELLDLGARDEPELVEDPCEADPRALPEPYGLVAPTTHQLLDERASLFAPQPAARRELLGERVRTLGGQRDRADACEDEFLRELADGISGLGHEVVRCGAGGGVRAFPAQSLPAVGARRRATARALLLRPAQLPRAPRSRHQPRQELHRAGAARDARGSRRRCRPPAPGPCGARTRARAPSRW